MKSTARNPAAVDSPLFTAFTEELEICAHDLQEYLIDRRYLDRFKPDSMGEAVTLYVQSGGKRLRPAILLWSCGALGGDVRTALPAAAAVEVFHTWTLVHDDIIDRDLTRRGADTVHERFRRIAKSRYSSVPTLDSVHYGTSVAILAGDAQHGWGISMMTELSRERGVDPAITLHLIEVLDNRVLNLLVEGEILDLQFARVPIERLDIETIEGMLWKKTGVLYRFCAEAGAMIGLGRPEEEHPQVRALAEFSSRCGIAFQLQDDILGVLGDPKRLGKPVGSDIREGKRTTVVRYAYTDATPAERELLGRTLGRSDAGEEEIAEVVEILTRRGGVEKTRRRAQQHIEEALPYLEELPPSRWRDLLRTWGEYMIERSL